MMKLSIFIGFSVCLFEGTTTTVAAATMTMKNFRGSIGSARANSQGVKHQLQQQHGSSQPRNRRLPQISSNVLNYDFIAPGKEKKEEFNHPNGDLRGSGEEVDTRIVGGSSSEIGDFPYFVDVLETGCGGTLIAPQVVLTAHHCDKENNRFKGENVMIGAFEKDEEDHGAVEMEVEDQVGHHGYDPNEGHRQAFDFLLLKLKEPIYINEPRATIVEDAGIADTTPAGTMLRVIGLGRLSHEGDSTDFLQDVEVPVVDFNKCQEMYSEDDTDVEPDIMFCAGDTEDGGIDSCSGDSGGPIVLEKNDTVHVLKGVVSWGKDCAHEDYPGVYAKVSAAYGWIQSVACDEWNVEADFCEGYTGTSRGTTPPACDPVSNYVTEFGDCSTYASGIFYNHQWCDEDVGTNGILALDACPECGACVKGG